MRPFIVLAMLLGAGCSPHPQSCADACKAGGRVMQSYQYNGFGTTSCVCVEPEKKP